MMSEQNETRAESITRLEADGRLVPSCAGCAEFYAAADPRSVFAPSHKASRRCESGKRPHCTCSACF